MSAKILLRRGTSTQWTTVNPVLAAGEQGLETDTNKIKIGNGSSVWTALAYFVGSSDASNAVHLTGAETISGVKTFSASPIVPNPTNTTDAANKSYIDSALSTATSGFINQSQLSSYAVDPTAIGATITGTNGITVTESGNTITISGNGSGSSSSNGIVTANTQTANYTLAQSDVGKVVEMESTAFNTLTIPSNASVSLPIGAYVEVNQTGSGRTNIVAASGVILHAPLGSALKSQYAVAHLRKKSTNEWIASGNLVTNGISDSFTRPDNTTSLGTADSGQTWNAVKGTWGISNGRAYSVSSTDDDTAILDSALTDQHLSVVISSGIAGMIIRSDSGANNLYLVHISTDSTQSIYKKVSGSYTAIASTPSVTSGSTVEVDIIGTTLTVKQNGTTIATVTDSSVTSGTYAGLRQSGSSPMYWDNLSVT